MKIKVIKSYVLSLLLTVLIWLPGGTAGAMNAAEAESIFNDSFTIWAFVGARAVQDAELEKNPELLRDITLFWVYDAIMTLESAPEAGDDGIILSFNGQELRADQAASRYSRAELFQGIPDRYNFFVSRQAAEMASLWLTGRKLIHRNFPANPEGMFWGGVLLDDRGYWFTVDGVGDPMREPLLQDFYADGDGWILKGQILEEGEEPQEAELRLSPGDAPGTWKRISFIVSQPD